jgi:hypothetical protein
MTARIKLALLAAGIGLALVAAIPTLAASIAPGTPVATAQVAIVHLAPFAAGNATAVTVTVDSALVISNVVYGQSTGYMTVSEGSHQVQIYPGASSSPAISETLVVTGGQSFTVVAVGNGTYQPLALKVLQDDVTAPVSGTVKVRIGHLAPFSNTIPGTEVDVLRQNGTPVTVTTNLPYGAVSPYITLPGGRYDFQITKPGGTPTLIDPLAVTLAPGSIVSLFAAGDRVNQPLGVFELPSGQMGHFLPLANFKLYLPWVPR